MNPTRSAACAFVALAVAANSPAVAQTRAQPSGGEAAPAVMPAQARSDATTGPYIRPRGSVRDWILRATLVVQSTTPLHRDRRGMPAGRPFAFETMGVLWPAVEHTAGSVTALGRVSGDLRLDGRSVGGLPVLLEDYPAGASLFRFDAGGPGFRGQAAEVTLEVEVPVQTTAVEFDERRALEVPWPRGAWPAVAASALEPQLWVEIGYNEQRQPQPYDAEPVKRAVEGWLRQAGIADPKASTPVRVAKAVAGGVWRDIQISGNGLAPSRTAGFAGIQVQAPVTTLREGRGSPHDVTALLAASLRLTGLPARTVIGWDVTGRGDFLRANQKENKLRSWVEFALYDEAPNTLNWVPIDMERMRRSASRPPALDREWRFFGTHPELNTVVPIAVQFSPPTDAGVYGWPALWGWFVTPEMPAEADVRLQFRAETAPRVPTPATRQAPGRPAPADGGRDGENRRGTGG